MGTERREASSKSARGGERDAKGGSGSGSGREGAAAKADMLTPLESA